MGILLLTGITATELDAQPARQTEHPERVPAEASKSGNLVSLTKDDTAIAVTAPGSLDVGRWRVLPEFSYKGEATRPESHGIPNWQLALRTSRALGRLELGVAASVTRGHPGPVFLSQELGTGRDLSADTPFVGPNSYKTVADTTVTIALPLKSRGRVRMKAVGEIWNPLSRSGPGGSDSSVLPSRAIRSGWSRHSEPYSLMAFGRRLLLST